MFAEVDAEALVFGADEDGGDDVAAAVEHLLVIVEDDGLDRCTHMKTPKQILWAIGWCFVSNMLKQIKPTAPTIANMIAQTLRNASRFL